MHYANLGVSGQATLFSFLNARRRIEKESRENKKEVLVSMKTNLPMQTPRTDPELFTTQRPYRAELRLSHVEDPEAEPRLG